MNLDTLLLNSIFCFARNQDDHTKNISFLMDETCQWSLSSAYDVTYAYNLTNIWMKAHQMSINGKRDEINRNDLVELAKKMNIKKSKEIIESVLETVANWTYYAKKAKVDLNQMERINKVLRLKL